MLITSEMVAVRPVHDERGEIGRELAVIQLRLEVGERSVDGPIG